MKSPGFLYNSPFGSNFPVQKISDFRQIFQVEGREGRGEANPYSIISATASNCAILNESLGAKFSKIFKVVLIFNVLFLQLNFRQNLTKKRKQKKKLARNALNGHNALSRHKNIHHGVFYSYCAANSKKYGFRPIKGCWIECVNLGLCHLQFAHARFRMFGFSYRIFF